MPNPPDHPTPSSPSSRQSLATVAAPTSSQQDQRGDASETPGREEPNARMRGRDETPIRFPSRPAAVAKSRSRAWLILPMCLAGLAVAIAVGTFMQRDDPQSVSEVARQVRDIVLARGERAGMEDGGAIGSLWIAAREADALTGTFIDMQIRAGQVRLAARTGRLIVDAEENTISFALEEVVLVRIPSTMSDYAPATGESILNLDSYVIGPIPYKRKIIADGHPAGERKSPGQLAGAR